MFCLRWPIEIDVFLIVLILCFFGDITTQVGGAEAWVLRGTQMGIKV